MEAAQLSLLDYDAGAARRDAGMIEAEFAEVLSGSDYPAALAAAIRHVALRQCEVHIDDVLPLIKAKPSHPNCAGAIWTRARVDGVLGNEIRRRKCTTDAKKNAHAYPVYESGLFFARKSA